MSFAIEARLRKEIGLDNLGFRSLGSRGYSYHIWISETEYRILTPAERRVLFSWFSSNKIRRMHAVGNFSRGYVVMA